MKLTEFKSAKWWKQWHGGAYAPDVVVRGELRRILNERRNSYMHEFDFIDLEKIDKLPRCSGPTMDLIFIILSDLRTPFQWYPKIMIGLGIEESSWLAGHWKQQIREYLEEQAIQSELDT